MALSAFWGRSAGCDMGSGGGIKLENLLTTLQEPHRSSNGNNFPLATTTLRKVF